MRMSYRTAGVHTKMVDGIEYPSNDFAYVPDPDRPETWKLPIPDMRHVAAAEAAMNSNYRGNPVRIPDAARQLVARRIARRRAELEAEQHGFD